MAHKLKDIEPGTRMRVLGVVAADNDRSYVQQIMRLGLTPGTTFRLIRRAPLGDPVEIKLRGYSLALRPGEADALEVQVIE